VPTARHVHEHRSVCPSAAHAYDLGVARTGASSRFPRWVYGIGTEPDPRFSLANERTFLAWVRTSLALSAAGVALEALTLPVHPGVRRVAALLLIVLGILAAVQAWWRWGQIERAVRCGEPLPAPVLSVVVAAGCGVTALLLFVGLLLP
jgi:putative membrane protein